jgi:hypothetical protein
MPMINSGAVIGLQQDQTEHAADDDEDGQQRVLQLVDPVHASFENQRGEQNRRDLGELRWLDAEATDVEPATGAVDRRTEQHGDEHQADERDRAPDERVIPIGAVVDPHRNRQHRHPEDRPQRLLVQKVVALIEALQRDDG